MFLSSWKIIPKRKSTGINAVVIHQLNFLKPCFFYLLVYCKTSFRYTKKCETTEICKKGKKSSILIAHEHWPIVRHKKFCHFLAFWPTIFWRQSVDFHNFTQFCSCSVFFKIDQKLGINFWVIVTVRSPRYFAYKEV